MSAAAAHHLAIGPEVVAGNGDAGRIFLLPGSPARAERIAAHFDDHRVHRNARRHDVHTGRLTRGGLTIDVATVATGMGCPSLGIIVSELLALGARSMVRVGTSGSLQPDAIDVGDLVIATAAVRDESTSDVFCPRDVPAVAHPAWVSALSRAAVALGHGDRTFRGLVHAKDALYGREQPTGPLAEQSARYMQMLADTGVLATEMESSHLFVLAQATAADLRPINAGDGPHATVVQAGTVLAVIGVGERWAGADDAARAEARAIDVALQGAVELVRGGSTQGS